MGVTSHSPVPFFNFLIWHLSSLISLMFTKISYKNGGSSSKTRSIKLHWWQSPRSWAPSQPWYPVIHWDMIPIRQRRDPGMWGLENPHQCFLRHSSSNDKGWACGYCFGCKDIKELMMLLFSVCFSEDPQTLIVSIAEKHYWDEHKLIISPWCVSEYAYQDSNKHLNQ